jgi:CrcB protein
VSIPGWLLVAAGSALGGVGRYGLALLWPAVPGRWPVATMGANLLGSFAIGALSVLLGARADSSAALDLRLFLMTGVLGGFTTYSAFALESLLLAQGGAAWRSAGYVAATIALCLLAAWVGRALAGAWITEA